MPFVATELPHALARRRRGSPHESLKSSSVMAMGNGNRLALL